jgi:hypothetical protein
VEDDTALHGSLHVTPRSSGPDHPPPTQLLNFIDDDDSPSTIHSSSSSSSSATCIRPSYYEFTLPNKDPIVVVPLDETNTTGIISYVKQQQKPQQQQPPPPPDGDNDSSSAGSDCYYYYVHTLNMPSGAMVIHVSDELIWVVGL